MTTKLFIDETIKKHIKKYGKEEYIKQLEARLKKGEEDYKRGKQQIEHILDRIKELIC